MEASEKLTSLISIIRNREAEIRQLGIAHLQIVGSLATGTATSDSDLDILADFTLDFRGSYFALARVQMLLEAELAMPVDVLLGSAFNARETFFKRTLHVF